MNFQIYRLKKKKTEKNGKAHCYNFLIKMPNYGCIPEQNNSF